MYICSPKPKKSPDGEIGRHATLRGSCLFKACKFESCSGHNNRLMFAAVFFCARRAPVSDPSPSPFQGRGVGRGAPDESVAMVTTGAGDFAILQ